MINITCHKLAVGINDIKTTSWIYLLLVDITLLNLLSKNVALFCANQSKVMNC